MINIRNKSVKKIVLSAILCAILFVQEQVLSFIPNVQFTFLLITLYGAVMKMKYGTLIILVHVILDNLYMGSFNFITIVPMFIGYMSTLTFGYLTRNKKLYIICILSSISIIIYTQMFALTNVLFLDINYFVYMINDIPFTIMLIIFSTLTIIWLYNPLYKVLNDNNN